MVGRRTTRAGGRVFHNFRLASLKTSIPAFSSSGQTSSSYAATVARLFHHKGFFSVLFPFRSVASVSSNLIAFSGIGQCSSHTMQFMFLA